MAAANPLESAWNPNKTIVENIQLPHTLMSRFDLIFLVLDPKDEAYDRKLATHLVSLYHTDRQDVAKGDKTEKKRSKNVELNANFKIILSK